MTVPSTGWFAEVSHPDTGRTLPAEAAGDPVIEPSLNTLPRIELPVPRSEHWLALDETLSEVVPPDLTVYRDGVEQPIDHLIRIHDDRRSQVNVLEGRGGSELLNQIDEEFDAVRRVDAARDVITTYTSYDADIDVPTDVDEGRVMMDPSTTAEFNARIDLPDTAPVTFDGDEYKHVDTSFTFEAETTDGGGWSDTESDTAYSDGSAGSMEDIATNPTWGFTTEHDIPEGNVAIQYRREVPTTDNNPAFDVKIDGTVVDSYPEDVIGQDALGWSTFTVPGDFGLTAGAHTLEIDVTSGTGQIIIDAITVFDDRFNHDAAGTGNDFDNQVHEANGYLDDPTPKPHAVTTAFDDVETALDFAVVGGALSADIDATDATTTLQISNDGGSTWRPSDGSETDTSSVTVDEFPGAGRRIRPRFTLGRHAPQGARSQTPRLGYASQTVASFELTADVEETSLLFDVTVDDSIEDVLTTIAGNEFVWAYRVVDGTPTVTFTPVGHRVRDTDPAFTTADVRQRRDTVHEFTVRGANRSISGERFSASTISQNLNESDIIPASESVRDPDTGEQFLRGDDYEMDWSAGQIRSTDEGDMVVAETYEISYRAEVKASHTDPNAPTGHRARTVDILTVTSERDAEQIAFELVRTFKEPRWIAEVEVPHGAVQFDAVEAFPLTSLADVPDAAGPLPVVEPPEVTPEGTRFRLASRPGPDEAIQALAEEVRLATRRSG